MKVRYDKLWRLMKDNKLKKTDLAKAAEISSYTNIGRADCVPTELFSPLFYIFKFLIGQVTMWHRWPPSFIFIISYIVDTTLEKINEIILKIS